MSEMLSMGNYGTFVWGSYSLTLIVMIACVVQARRRQRRIYRQIESRLKAMEKVE